MDKKLRGLFGYQKFEGNSKLDKLISETESRVGVELNDDQLDMVNAAKGVPDSELQLDVDCGRPIRT